MGRRGDQLYAGAAGAIALERIRGLGSSWALQRKLDGAYSIVSTDARGRVSAALTRSGEPLPPDLLRGVRWAPNAVLCGEAEAYAERGVRARELRGHACLWLFDALRLDGRDLSALPYRERRDALRRAEAELAEGDVDRPWHEDRHDRAHDLASGRYTRRTPRSWRRVRIVDQLPVSRLDDALAWIDDATDCPTEGIVCVNLDAPIGRRGSKVKYKPVSTIDVVVTQLDARALVCHWIAADKRVVVARPRSLDVTVGSVVEIRHESFYADGTPRFARVSRTRPDLARAPQL